MTDRMSAAEFLASQARKGKCSVCGLGSRPHKYGAKAVVDPETGTRIPSKHEARVLAMKRLEADARGWITALHPRFRIEGGHWSGDLVEIEIDSTVPTFRDGWNEARVRFLDAKGHLTAASRRSIKATEERYGVRVQVIRAKSRGRRRL